MEWIREGGGERRKQEAPGGGGGGGGALPRRIVYFGNFFFLCLGYISVCLVCFLTDRVGGENEGGGRRFDGMIPHGFARMALRRTTGQEQEFGVYYTRKSRPLPWFIRAACSWIKHK